MAVRPLAAQGPGRTTCVGSTVLHGPWIARRRNATAVSVMECQLGEGFAIDA